MAACAPQRFLANNRNAVREATLTPSSVLPVEESVLSIPTARGGTAQVAITGAYEGEEEATYDFEIVDDDVDTPIISAPVFTGEGSGTLEDISSSLPAQEIVVELSESGLPLLAAQIDFEGVTVKARTAGAAGNSIHFDVDQSGLTFTPQAYSLLNDLEAGAGGPDSPMTGAEFDYDTKVLGADNAIPTAAHRISFGTDPNIYLQWKAYEDGLWKYYLAPELKRAVPQGAVVNFVTGGRTVTVYPGSPGEVYTGIITLYDLLNALKTQSVLVDVDGVVANDRSPTGQASHELQTRTDAYHEPTSGEGGDSAQGFENVTVEAAAGTQLVIATCRAVSAADHPQAGVGRTRWELKSSTLGDLGTIIENEPFEGDEFAVTVPQRLPYGLSENVQKGRFTVAEILYETRDEGEEEPPICPGPGDEAGKLGPDASDQTITLVWTRRPSGACLCEDLPIPDLGGSCLGIFTEGGADMAYSTDAQSRLVDLYDWAAELITAVTSYKAGYAFDGIPEEKGGIMEVPSGGFTAATEDPGTSLTVSRTFAGPLSSATLSRTAVVTTVSSTDNLIFDTTPVATGYADEAMPANFQSVIDFYELGIARIDQVTDTGLKAAGFAQWDAALAIFTADLDSTPLGTLGNRLQSIAENKYKTLVRQAMAYAGIPQVGGADASTLSGDGCWQDYGGDYFTVEGSDKGAYAPLFPNQKYFSSRRASSTGTYYSTQEFAIYLAIKCVEKLKYGDTIRMVIGDAGWPAMYHVGDQLVLPIIGANDLYLAGGQDSSLEQLWYVTGSESGALAPYDFDPEAPVPYSAGGLAFELVPGGIDFAKGDRFKFSIEGGHYRWRKNGGAWEDDSPPLAITSGAVAFDDGLSVTFTPGAAPSFVSGDMYSFRALQPWAVSNLRTPTVERWQWDGATVTVDIDLGSVQDLDMLAIALHTLPEGATLSLQGGVAGIGDWTETPIWREDLIVLPFTDTRSARYLRLSLAGATGGGIGWLWVGVAFATTRLAYVTPHRAYRFARGDGGNNPVARFLGKGRGADVAWQEAALTDGDMTGLAALLDWVKEQDDEWLVFLAQVTRPTEAMLVQITDDQIEEHDLGDGNRNADVDRLFDVRLSLGPVLT